MQHENRKTAKKPFTETEKKILCGLAPKVAEKHGCSSMYVRYLIHGQRNTHSLLARSIVKDLRKLLKLFGPGA